MQQGTGILHQPGHQGIRLFHSRSGGRIIEFDFWFGAAGADHHLQAVVHQQGYHVGLGQAGGMLGVMEKVLANLLLIVGEPNYLSSGEGVRAQPAQLVQNGAHLFHPLLSLKLEGLLSVEINTVFLIEPFYSLD